MAEEIKNEAVEEEFVDVTTTPTTMAPTANPGSGLKDFGMQVGYSAGLILATSVAVNAGGQILNLAGKGLKKIGTGIANGVRGLKEKHQEKKLLKSQEETVEEETEE